VAKIELRFFVGEKDVTSCSPKEREAESERAGESVDQREYIGEVDVTVWSAEDRVAYLAEVGKLEQAKGRIRELTDDAIAAEESPARRIERAREEREAAEQVQAELERATLEEIQWTAIVKKYGKKKVKRLATKAGMVVVRCPTYEEAKDQGLAMADITPAERVEQTRQYFLDLIVHPPEREKAEAIGNEYPSFWDDVNIAVALLQSSRAAEARPFV
jgi:hypothetical protein